MEVIINKLQNLDVIDDSQINLQRLMINDIHSIQECYENMLNGYDFELILSDDPDYQYLEKETMGEFVKQNYYNIISKNILVNDKNLLDSIVDYYLEQNFCSYP